METTVLNLIKNRGLGACALLVIMTACGLVMTPSAAHADYVSYGGYYYYDAPTFYPATVQTYVEYTPYKLYVEKWVNPQTQTESFVDAGGREWRIVKTTWEVKRGYEYLGAYTYNTRPYYQQLCGRIRWCPHTKMYIYVCECGRSFYWIP